MATAVDLSTELDRVAAAEGELRLTVPLVYLEARNPLPGRVPG